MIALVVIRLTLTYKVFNIFDSAQQQHSTSTRVLRVRRTEVCSLKMREDFCSHSNRHILGRLVMFSLSDDDDQIKSCASAHNAQLEHVDSNLPQFSPNPRCRSRTTRRNWHTHTHTLRILRWHRWQLISEWLSFSVCPCPERRRRWVPIIIPHVCVTACACVWSREDATAEKIAKVRKEKKEEREIDWDEGKETCDLETLKTKCVFAVTLMSPAGDG